MLDRVLKPVVGKKLHRRFQPVIMSFCGERYVTLVEIQLDDRGSLRTWQLHPDTQAIGDDVDGLDRMLAKMFIEARAWEPVEFSALRVGMHFKPRMARNRRNKILKNMLRAAGINKADED